MPLRSLALGYIVACLAACEALAQTGVGSGFATHSLLTKLQTDEYWHAQPSKASQELKILLSSNKVDGFAILLKRLDGWSEFVTPGGFASRKEEPWSVQPIICAFSPGEGENLIEYISTNHVSLTGLQQKRLNDCLMQAFGWSIEAYYRSATKVLERSKNKKETVSNLKRVLPGFYHQFKDHLNLLE